jgi:DNA-binding MarR family transcriptional regulator
MDRCLLEELVDIDKQLYYAAGVPSNQNFASVEQALERLYRLTSSRKANSRQAAAVGTVVARAGYNVLRCVHDARHVSLGEIAQHLSMDPAAAGRQVRSLEQDGLVVRSTDKTDARVTNVALTPRGREVYRRIVTVRTGHLRDVLSAWSPDDCVALATLLDRLVDDLRSVPFRSNSPVGATK